VRLPLFFHSSHYRRRCGSFDIAAWWESERAASGISRTSEDTRPDSPIACSIGAQRRRE
jgi:hypothetical protein